MMRTILVLAGLLLVAADARGADDTFACLDSFDGPVTVVPSSNYGEQRWTGIEEGARFDARKAVILQQTDPPRPDGSINDYPLDLRTSGTTKACWAGGVVHNTNDPNISWKDSKKPNNAAIIAEMGSFTFDGLRIHNAHDSFRPARRQEGDSDFTIRNSWVTYSRDDCVENDHMAGGLIEDNLFDGCYVFLSSRNKGKFTYENVVTLRGNLIRMQKMPEPFGQEDTDIWGHGTVFKYEAQSPDLVLENNIFLVEGLPITRGRMKRWIKSAPTTLGFRNINGQLAGCKNNTIVWLGLGPYPGDVPGDCVTITTDRSVWDKAREDWITRHPKVGRIPGLDPAPAAN